MAKQHEQINIKGAILAGGRALRMGGLAKGMLADHSSQPIIVHLMNQMRLAGINDIVISANDASPYSELGIQTVPDLREGVGPLAGIEAVLTHFKDPCDGTMFIPCDVPNMTARELITLREAFVHSTEKIVFAETDGFFCHPLCAVVHNDMLAQIISSIDRGQRKVQQLWRLFGAKGVKFAEAAAFMNINSFSDVKCWRGNTGEKTLC